MLHKHTNTQAQFINFRESKVVFEVGNNRYLNIVTDIDHSDKGVLRDVELLSESIHKQRQSLDLLTY